ncbi:MAG: TM1812 family CRISPR-associated protein [Clostridiales bacterium]|nr:TM1812 family CRISPR-associated protein [Clostridiales bacterium]
MAQEKNQKIILFLSTPNPYAKQVDYDCPGDSTVSGVQTYDAPIKYLLSTHGAVSEILCIVTSDAKEQSWGRFEKELVPEALREAKRKEEEVVCTPIAFPENASIKEVLPDILNRTHEGDEILLETTGGLRNAMMYLLLISRALSYKKVNTTCAVYSNYQPKKGIFRVEDVTDMLQVFDLIDGMQNLTSFGNVRVLQEYYKDSEDEKIKTLLAETNRLWEYITLCRPNPVPEQIERFNQALDAAEDCNDPLLKALLPAFRSAFEEKMTILHLIRWCAKNDMIQQALTLYRECIPDYILNTRPDILTVKPKTYAESRLRGKGGRVKNASACFNLFLKIGGNTWYEQKYKKSPPCGKDGKKKEDYLLTLENFEDALGDSADFQCHCTTEELRAITMDFMYVHALRNMADHADDHAETTKRPLLEYLERQKGYGYTDPEKATVDEVKQVILNGLDHLKLQPQEA